MSSSIRGVTAAAIAGVLSLFGSGGSPAPATTIVAFDFENATAGDSTAAASAVGSGISGTEFGGSRVDSEVLLVGGPDQVYRSAALDMTTNGGNFNYFSFTTSQTVSLGQLSFIAGQNDTTSGSRDFKVLLSPVDAATPSGHAGDLTGYTELATIAVPNGFAIGAPNFDLDLSGTLTPGEYHFAFVVSNPSQFTEQGSTQLFIDDVLLTPEPSTAALLAGGLLGLALRRRRLR